MAKVQTNIRGTQFDPYKKEDQIANLFGGEDNNGTPAETGLLEKQDTLATLSSVNLPSGKSFSLLGDDALAQSTIKETQAAEQGILDLTGKFLWNVGSTVLTEIGKIPGYVGGAAGAVANEAFGDGKNSMSIMVDNAWINAFESMDESMKSVFPVHISKEVEEGDLLNKMTSGQWWASTGADGVGFLVSMFLPGQASKLLGAGKGVARIGELLGNAAPKFGKAMTKAGLLDNLAGAGKFAFTDKFANGANGAFSALLNSSLESAAEAANTFDNVKSKFIKEGYSEEEANSLAGNRAAAVFKANLPLLLLSNMIDEAWIWKSFGTGQKTAANNVLSKIFSKEGKLDINAVKALQKKGFKDNLIDSAIGFGEGIAKEGFLEEGSQTLLQQQIEEEGSAGTGLDNLGRVAKEYLNELLTNPEMQESIALGGLLGGGMSIIGSISENKNYNRQLFGSPEYTPKNIIQKLFTNSKKETPGLIKTFTDNYITLTKSLSDVYQKDENGNIKLDDSGKPIVDEVAYGKLLEDKKSILEANQKYDIAVAKGDTVEAEQLGNALMFNYVLPFIKQEGGFELLKDHIATQVVPAWAERFNNTVGRQATEEEVKQYKDTFLEKATNLNSIYSSVDSTHMPERYFITDDPDYKDWKDNIFKSKIALLMDNSTYQKVLSDITKKESELGVSVDEAITDEIKDKLSPEQIRQLEFFKGLKKFLVKVKKDTTDKYLELFTKNGLEKSFKEYKTYKEKILKESLKEAQNQQVDKMSVAQGNAKNNALSQAIIQAGYSASTEDSGQLDPDGIPITRTIIADGEVVHLKDGSGKRYVAITKDGKTFLYNSKGQSAVLTAGLIAKQDLVVIPKDQVLQENKAYRLQKRKNIQLALIEDILNYNKQKLVSTEQELKDINKKIEEYENNLADLSKELDSKSISKQDIEQRIKEVEFIIKELSDRKSYLEGLKLRYETFVTEYTKLKQETEQEEQISFNIQKQNVEVSILERIKLLEEDVDLSDTVTETQNQLNNITSLIQDLNKTIEKSTRIRDELQKFLDNDKAFKTILLSEYLLQQDLIRLISEALPGYYGIKDYVARKLKDNKLSDLLVDPDFKTGLLRRLKNIDENYANKFNDIYNRIESILQTGREVKLQAEERYAAEQVIALTNQEIKEATEELSKLSAKKDILELNKRYLVLQQITSKRIEEEFKRRVYKESIEDNQEEKTGFEEPGTKDLSLHDEFLNHQLGLEAFVTTGLSIMYDKEGQFKGKDSLTETGLPVLNPSLYQRVWFNVIDKLARTSNITDFKLMLYVPDYQGSNKSQLQVQIELNNPVDRRSDKDLFVVLVDSTGNPVFADENGNLTKTGTAVFTSLWRPETLYPNDSLPRLAPDAMLKPWFDNIKTATRPSWSRLSELEIDKIFRSVKDREIIADKVGTQEFTKDDILEAAIKFNKDNYTKWYNTALKSNGGYVEILDITSGRPVVKKDVNTREIKWNPVLENVEGVRLIPRTFGTKQLEGATLTVATTGEVKKGTFVKKVPKGEVILQLNSGEITPLQQRMLTESEIDLVMYLLSLGIKAANAPADSITVSLPDNVYYKINNVEIRGQVPVFYSNNREFKNFSLLHSIIAYGRKREGVKKAGEIFVATNRQEVIYTGFDNSTKAVPLSEVKNYMDTQEVTPDVQGLLDFLKQKRFNVSHNMINQNGVFPYPVLKKKRNTKGEYEYSIDFDTKKSYYEFLLEGNNPVLRTSLIRASGYPQFAQRNIVFNPSITVPNIEDKTAINPESREIESPVSNSKAEISEEVQEFRFKQQLDSISERIKNATNIEELNTVKERVDANFKALENSEDMMTEDGILFKKMVYEKIEDAMKAFTSAPSAPATSFMSMNFSSEPEQLGFDQIDKVLLPEDLLKTKIKSGEIKQKCK